MSQEITEDSLMVVGGKRRGRPIGSKSNKEPGSAVMTWLPASEHDRIARMAHIHGETVSSMVRLLLTTRWQK